jgi:hypothetical protein
MREGDSDAEKQAVRACVWLPGTFLWLLTIFFFAVKKQQSERTQKRKRGVSITTEPPKKKIKGSFF